MPFLRFSRDKRGYEHVYLVQPISGRRGKTRQRILYWFRTPPNVRVGREAFDEQAKRALEAQNPDVTFDWAKLLDTPMPPPPPDAERWRERRRAERAARLAPSGDMEDESAIADIEALVVEPEVATEVPSRELVPHADMALTPSAEALPPPASWKRRRRRGGRSNRRVDGRVAADQAPADSAPDASPEKERPFDRSVDEPEGE